MVIVREFLFYGANVRVFGTEDVACGPIVKCVIWDLGIYKMNGIQS